MSMRFVTIVGGLLMLTAGGSAREPLPGMPPVLDARDIYSETRPGKLSPVVRDFPRRVYVPNSGSNTVDVIDPETYKIVDHFRVGKQPQHVTPSYDLKTLWVLNDLNNTNHMSQRQTKRWGISHTSLARFSFSKLKARMATPRSTIINTR